MNFNIVFDISSLVWDESDFDANSKQYYNILYNTSVLFEKLNFKNTLIRKELSTELMSKFPYEKIKNLKKYGNDFWDIGRLVIQFLGKIDNEGNNYPTNCDSTINSVPNIIKPHFNDSLKKEICYITTKIHSEDEKESIYFTFKYFWDNNTNLKSVSDKKTNTYETIIADRDNDLEDFFQRFKLIFEHKEPKHDCSVHKNRDAWYNSDEKSNFPSQLSCYHDKCKETVQKILDKRYYKCFGNEFYYSYDVENNVYVVFRKTLNNVYHGYDMYEIERVPQEVKDAFRIWSYK